LAYQEHRYELDLHEERVQQVSAVEQRVVLQADAPSGVEECLKVLIVVVQVVLVAEKNLDDLCVSCRAVAVGRFHLLHVFVPSETARDIARRKRPALKHRDDADAILNSLWRDEDDGELLGRETEALGTKALFAGPTDEV